MPMYEFKCDNCCKIFERFCSINENEIICPNCNNKIKKIISLSNFKLEGNHWEKDSYGLKNKK